MKDKKQDSIKVLIIDDSAFSRQTIKEILEKSPDIKVVGIAVDGYDGMKKIQQLKPDAITLDLEMPGLDGFTLLRWIMTERPLMVIVVSAYGDKPTVFKALELGAVDFVVKPTKKASWELREIENDLLRKILETRLLNIDKVKRNISLLESSEVIDTVVSSGDDDIEMVGIGASTGGPTAIQTILTRLPRTFPGMMVISQHMPRGFTRQFANRISKISALRVKEADHGEPVENGTVLICPGGQHLTLEKSRGKIIAAIRDSSLNDKYVPSVDIMMESIAEIYGPKGMGVVLTGMGNDGKAGMLKIKKRGGVTIAESEESSVVFGMPHEVILAGAADMVLPLEEIPAEILKKMKKGS